MDVIQLPKCVLTSEVSTSLIYTNLAYLIRCPDQPKVSLIQSGFILFDLECCISQCRRFTCTH